MYSNPLKIINKQEINNFNNSNNVNSLNNLNNSTYISNNEKNETSSDIYKIKLQDYICGNSIINKVHYNLNLDLIIEGSKYLSGKQLLLIIPITKFFKKFKNLYILSNILNGSSIVSLRLIDYFVVNYVLENNTFYNIQKYKCNPDFVVNNLTKVINDNNDIKNQISRDIINHSLNKNNNYNKFNSEFHSDFNSKFNNKFENIINTNNFDDLFIIHDNYKCQLKEYNKKNFDPFCRDTRIKLYYDNNNYFETTVAQLNFFKWAIDNYIIDYILDNYKTIEKSMLNYERVTKLNKLNKLNLLNGNKIKKHKIKNNDNKNNKIKNNINSMDTKINNTKNNTRNNTKNNTKNNENTIKNKTTENNYDEKKMNILKQNNVLKNNSDILKNNNISPNDNETNVLNNNILNNIQSNDNSSSNLFINSNLIQKKTKKNEIYLGNLDKKSKHRKKKEFSKTNKSILSYKCKRVINFN